MSIMTRKKTVATFTISHEAIARLEKWIASLELPPSKSSVVERALVEFLDRKDRSKR